MKIEERNFTIEEAQQADEAFITSASAFVTPVVELDGQKIFQRCTRICRPKTAGNLSRRKHENRDLVAKLRTNLFQTGIDKCGFIRT